MKWNWVDRTYNKPTSKHIEYELEAGYEPLVKVVFNHIFEGGLKDAF